MIGRPNVGKSSLVNAFLGQERVIVDERPAPRGTRSTRASRWTGAPVVLVDTAGLRRQSKVAGTVDWYAQLRSERAAERADVALVVCDATEGVTSEDLRIADLAMRNGCATIVVLNKWDVTQTDLEDAKERVAKKLRLRPRVLTASALSGRNVTRAMVEAVALADRSRARISTPDLNRFVSEVQSQRQPPAVRGKRLRIYYATQVEAGPPRFRLYVNDRRLVVRDYGFFVENRLRARYRLEGVPLVIDFVDRERRGQRSGRRVRRLRPPAAALRALTFDRIARCGPGGGRSRPRDLAWRRAVTSRAATRPCGSCHGTRSSTGTRRVEPNSRPVAVRGARSCASCRRCAGCATALCGACPGATGALDFERQLAPVDRRRGRDRAAARRPAGKLADPGASRRPGAGARLPARRRHPA